MTHTLPTTMAPVATADSAPQPTKIQKEDTVFNPFYSPSISDDGDESYRFAQYKVSCYHPHPDLMLMQVYPSLHSLMSLGNP